MIKQLTTQEIHKMRQAGQVLRQLLAHLKANVKVGTTGLELDALAATFISKAQCLSNFKGYHGFPNTICVSVNHHLIHGIPNDLPFQAGDLVSVDAGCIYQGYHADAAFSMIVGQGSEEAKKLLRVTQKALHKAIQKVKANVRVGTIAHTIESYVTKHGFHIPTSYAGHGIGTQMHQDPFIPNQGMPAGSGVQLPANTAICIEPMVQATTSATRVQADQWTVASGDQGLGCHFEHTILITKKGCEVLT